ncbi:hypothetical protein [Sphingomonas turrisvirgatae]|uniref:SnoaL-like domain-containing protein n=1 Tax=Sphingomonas turrisvirgatae TaxID=1888892 RepID=A0A1E3LWW5_9SPHN|nr:hypothetical protein [Sphingomonas turrisvirgatae]ODP37290.1 hypothetical protein BFL28_02775 [Sphingomonas turrisvirgatae]
MITVRRSTLKLLSIALGIAFTAGIYNSMHNGMGWDWKAPGTGKLPREIVRGFMAQAYDRGDGAGASRDYFASDAADNVPLASDRRSGAPVAHQVRRVIGEGLTVVVFHRIGAARGEPARDVVDIFDTRNGRIVKRERHVDAAAGQGAAQ